jgi:L-asparaginase
LKIRILTTGGTFDKVYFDAMSEFHFGDPIVGDLLREANVDFDYEIEPLMQKDSLEMGDADRAVIGEAVARTGEERILIIHGTDSMVETARSLDRIRDKTIVLFGAMQPARMRYSDALYNLGFACAAVQLLSPGVYLAMNGRIFDPRQVVKNREAGRFETAN